MIASPARLAALDSVKADLRRLADPRGLSDADADRLVRTLPAVTWLMHGVHGNEISSSDAALAEAYHLLAAQNDPDVELVRRDSIVVIDPMQNPDGRARFTVNNLLGAAALPDSNPLSAEHDEPWPGGRSNHYLFDMNRDWFSQSQPETRGRIAAMLDWFPHVVVDLHEMGGDSSYYFAPPAHPINPHVTRAQTRIVRSVRPRECGEIRRARLRVLRARELRRVLSGLRRVVADLSRRDRHDLRAGVAARPRLEAERRRSPVVSRRASSTTSRPR